MLEIELCRICLADSIRMYPIEHTRYHEVFEWYTEDTMDMNDELPYTICFLCNAVLDRLYNFLKNMIDTEIYLKEILRNTSKLTYESVEKLKREMTSKPYNLSKVWLRNSNFIALDAFKGHKPPKELRRYFDHPPIMIEYHKPYEHMKLEDIPEEQEPEEVNEEEPGEAEKAEIEETMEIESDEINEAESETMKEEGSEKIYEAETEELKEAGAEKFTEAGTEVIKESATKEKIEVETDQIKESKSGEVKDKKSPQQTSNLPEHESKSPRQNEDQPKPPQEFLKNQPEHIAEDSKDTADQDEFANDDEDIRLVWSDSENESQNIPNKIDDEPVIEYDNSSEQSNHKSESKYANKRTKTLDPIDSFLLCAKRHRPPEELAKSSNLNVTEETPYFELISIATEGKTQEKRVKNPEPVKFHNPYLQFIEERVPTQEKPPKKRLKTSEHKVKTPDTEKYHNQNLQLIEHIPVKVTEPGHTSIQMEIDNNIHTDTPPVNDQQNSTELGAKELEERYFNLYLETVKETPFKMSSKPLPKLRPVGRGSNKPVSKIIKPTKANDSAKIIVTSEPKKYIHSYVDFVKGKGYDTVKKTSISQHKKESHQEIVPIPPKNARKRILKKISRPNIVPKNPVQEKPSEKNYIDGKISGFCYFDHQKRFRRAPILRKIRHPNRNKREIEELANKIKNRAVVLRKKLQKTDFNAENAVTKPAPYDKDQPHERSKLQEKNSPKYLPLQSKEHSDKLLTEIPLTLPQDINKMLWHVVEYPVKSKLTDRVSDKHKDLNQGDKYNDQKDTHDSMWSDQEDNNTMDSQVDRALKVLDESMKHEDSDPILLNEDDEEHNMPNDKNDPPLLIKDDCIIIIEDNLEDDNQPKDQDDLSFAVQDVFTLEEQGSEDEHLVPKEQYDQIIMLANQDDQVIEDGNVAVKIESVDEDFPGCFDENHVNENIISDDETFKNEDVMDLNNESDGMIQHGDFKIEENIQIDDEVSEYEPYLQETVTLNENITQRDRDGPSDNETPNFETDYNEIQGLNDQEHYAIRNISQITMIPTVQLERLPIRLIKKTSTENNGTGDEIDKYSCNRCDFKTTVRLLMFRHQNVHDINKRFVCNVCQHRFLSHYHLSRHKVIHDRTKYYCAYCDFKTTVKFNMEKHQNLHSQFNRYPCKWCQKRFRSPSHRSRHSCTKKYKAKCGICNREFKNESNYVRHLEKHTGVVPKSYKCSICNKSFDSKKKYFNHNKQHRSGDSDKIKYTCKWCNRNFNHKSNCNKHMKLHEKHGEKVSLQTEDKQIMNETDDEMELHEKESDKFCCGLCSLLFDTEMELGRHAVDHIL